MRIAPVEKSLIVPAPPELAFRRFTREMDLWWPRSTHSVFETESASVEMGDSVGADIVEHSDGGGRCVWGTITVWDEPHRIAFTWHPGRPAEAAQLVEVRFSAVDRGTRVTLVHSGWETLGAEGPAMRDGYDEGWTPVLARYVASLDTGETSE